MMLICGIYLEALSGLFFCMRVEINKPAVPIMQHKLEMFSICQALLLLKGHSPNPDEIIAAAAMERKNMSLCFLFIAIDIKYPLQKLLSKR